MVHLSPPEAFAEPGYYSTYFMDPAVWAPFVRKVAVVRGFNCGKIRPGLPGTYPTFIVRLSPPIPDRASASIVVKFFGPLFDGEKAHAIEVQIGSFLEQHPIELHSPKILADGWLSPAWRYLIFEYIPGKSFGQARQELSITAMESVARQMGIFMKEFHYLTGNQPSLLKKLQVGGDWIDFASFLQEQLDNCLLNHTRWNDLPAHLLEQLPGYLPQVEEVLDLSSIPHLIHADLTGDHLLGKLLPTPKTSPITNGKEWKSLAIIDWGDCRVGNILYELVALHIDLFQTDKHLLDICLEAYGLPAFYKQDFAHKALAMTLLHQFPMPMSAYRPYQHVQSLDELAEGLFGVS
jgi:hypothetical protein